MYRILINNDREIFNKYARNIKPISINVFVLFLNVKNYKMQKSYKMC